MWNGIIPEIEYPLMKIIEYDLLGCVSFDP